VLVTGGFDSVVNFGGGAMTPAGGLNDDVFVTKLDPSGGHLWSKQFGGVGVDRGNTITSDSLDHITVTGNYNGAVDFGGGPLPAGNGRFIAQYTAAGAHLWSKPLSTGVTPTVAAAVADPAGNLILVGSTSGATDFGGGSVSSGSVFVVKLSNSGAFVWNKAFPGSGVTVAGAAVDSVGNILIAGDFATTASFGGPSLTSAGLHDAFVAKLDSTGAHVWSKRFGDVAEQHATGVAVDPAGNVAVFGQFASTIDFGGGVLSSAGAYDVFLAKLSSAGSHIWSQRWGGIGQDYAYSVANDSMGNVAFGAGFYGGNVDLGGQIVSDRVVAKLNAQGGFLWSNGVNWIPLLATAPGGAVVVAVSSSPTDVMKFAP
jgi:hypothetical protein